MEVVSIEKIEEVLNYFEKLDSDKFKGIMDEITEKQGNLLAYLLASSESINQDKAEYFFYTGFVILYILVELGKTMPMVGENDIDKRELKNTQLLEMIEGEDEDLIIEFIETAFKDYKQINLFAFVMDSVFDEDQAGKPVFNEDETSIAILTLKTIIDCMDVQGLRIVT